MKLLKKFLENELHLNPEEYLDKFILYERLLLEWNAKVNLISRKSISIEDHILNSIFFLTKYKFDKIFVLGLDKIEEEEKNLDVPEEIQILVKQRSDAKRNKDFKLADEMRNKIKAKGFEILDNKDGVEIRKI